MNRLADMLVWDQRVGSSNLSTPTKEINMLENDNSALRTDTRTDTTVFPSPVALKGAKTGRPAIGPRIYLRKDRDGASSWIIRDYGRDMRTGCREDDITGAELALDAYKQGQQILTRGDTIEGLVYFVTCTTSPHYPIKIGWTKTLAKRMQSMQGGNPNVLTALVTIPGTYRDERKLHSLFRHHHIRGEWFRRGDDLLAHIASLPGYLEAYGADEFSPTSALEPTDTLL